MSTETAPKIEEQPKPAQQPPRQLTEEEIQKKKRKEEAKKAAKAAKQAKFEAKKAAQKKQQEEAAAKKAAKKEASAPKAAAATEAPASKPYVNKTPAGEKKILEAEMESSYKPMAVEAAWYEWWEKSGFFKPEVNAGKGKGQFVMVIPPPNVTGSLHLGHALTNSIQDSIVRWHRMRGEEALWVPGTDHAGISTQVVVEKKLMREKGLTRHDVGREDFVKLVWDWKNEYGGNIVRQLRRIGSSVDWSREAFTMDPVRSRAVTEAFVRLHDAGLIYRDNRLVNWCCTLRTAISDIEVEYIDIPGPTKMKVPGHDGLYPFGELVHFAYPVEGSEGKEEVVCATTRIETMLADTAVAVHPDDKRYTHLHGKFVINPINGRRIPIICDPKLVELDFGTGCVKVTPAHDPNDFECGVRNKLEFINMLNPDGTLNDFCGEFAGMKRFDARLAIIEKLKELGSYRTTTPNPMRIALCSRSKDIIEPRLVPQWYVSCKAAAARSVEAVRAGEIKIVPKMFEADWYRWLENIHDWCVSRQLWWGHRIPAYLVSVRGRPRPDPIQNESWVTGRTEAEARERAAKKFGVPEADIELEQDPDVLDTWFSSGLFPFSAFEWPESTADLAKFFPTTLLETGYDILFFWVARMVMMSVMLQDGKVPFTNVMLHAMVRDAHGRKMSKSLGNVIDPVDVIEGITLPELHEKLLHGNLSAAEVEKARAGQKADFPNGIAECGTDAMRFALCAYTSQGRDINLDINRVIGYRNFCNKLWNAVRFALTKLGKDFVPAPSDPKRDVAAHPAASPVDKWILSRLATAVRDTNAGFEAYDLAAATTAVYSFWLYDLCDVYFEASKPTLSQEGAAANPEAAAAARETLYTCVETGLRLIHPFMPFVTEELWQRLPKRAPAEGKTVPVSIMIAQYPLPEEGYAELVNKDVEDAIATVMEVVRAIRNTIAPYTPTIKKTKKYPRIFLRTRAAKTAEIFAEGSPYAAAAKTLVLLCEGDIKLIPAEEQAPAGCAVKIVNGSTEVFSELKGIIDVDAELAKLAKHVKALESELAYLEKKTKDPLFDTKTPQDVREATFAKIEATKEELKVAGETAEAIKQMRA